MASNEDIIQTTRRNAIENDKHSGCAQAVLGALQQALGLGNVQSFKSATALSGGVARRGETCGALLGALMALGILIGRDRMEDTETYSRTVDISQRVVQSFQAGVQREFSLEDTLPSTLCRDIQARLYGRSFDLRNPDERALFLEAGGHSENGCPAVCGVAAEVAARELLKLRDE